MSWNPLALPDDPSDPVVRAYHRFKRRLRNIVLIVIGMAVVIVVFGVPSVQLQYTTYSNKDMPLPTERIYGEYWNPIGGWRSVQRSEIAPGMPLFLMMPLRLCMDLTPYKNRFTTFVLGEDFFDET